MYKIIPRLLSPMILTLLCVSKPHTGFTQNVWNQQGQNLTGEAATDFYGYDIGLSADALTLAVGGELNDAGGLNAGHARVFRWNATSQNWQQMGGDLDGTAADDRFGRSVSLSADGNTLAVGATGNDNNGSNAGCTYAYNWNGSAWVPKGAVILGETAGDASGLKVRLAGDGNSLAIAANSDAAGTEAGHVRIFAWNGSSWVQKGQDIDGEAPNDYFGNALALSADGNTVIAGSQTNDGFGMNAGHARVYSWNGTTWAQKGTDIDGQNMLDGLGAGVAVNANGSIVAAGSVGHDNMNGTDAGCISVFEWNGSAWIQVGQNILAEATLDRFGSSVGLSDDGYTVIGGSPLNTNANGNFAGSARVFRWTGSAWVQKGADLDGAATNDSFGTSVSISADGNTVAAGAYFNDLTATDAGMAQVFSCNSYANIGTINACGSSYTSPSGNHVWSSSGIYTDTLTSVAGCDSIITLNLVFISFTATVNTASAPVYAALPANSTSYQWINCNTGQPVAGATQQTFTPQTNGSYAVIINGGNNCIDTSACFAVTSIGIDENLSALNVQLYPVPADGLLQVTVSESCTVLLSDITGNALQTIAIKPGTNHVNTTELAAGIYFLVFTGSHGTHSRKIVVRH